MDNDKKLSQQAMKEGNISLIFRSISSAGAISRADLMRATGLSKATVSMLVEELMQKGLIIETGIKNTKTSGRKAILLSLNPDGGCFFCVDVATDSVMIRVYDLLFCCVCEQTVRGNELAALLKKAGNASENILKNLNSNVLGVCIGAAGIIDEQSRHMVSSTVLDSRLINDFADRLFDCCGDIPFFMVNDSSLTAFAEKSRRGLVRDLVSIDVRNGVGSGIVLDGEIYTGKSGHAGEFGHMSVYAGGDRCKCGNRGCIELFCGKRAILKHCSDALGHEVYTLAEVRAAAENNNKKVTAVLASAADALAAGITGIFNLLDPQLVVISGEVISALGDSITGPISAQLDDRINGKAKLVEFVTDADSLVAFGGAKYLFEQLF